MNYTNQQTGGVTSPYDLFTTLELASNTPPQVDISKYVKVKIQSEEVGKKRSLTALVEFVVGEAQRNHKEKPKPEKPKPQPKPEKPKIKPRPEREGDREPQEPRQPKGNYNESFSRLLAHLKHIFTVYAFVVLLPSLLILLSTLIVAGWSSPRVCA